MLNQPVIMEIKKYEIAEFSVDRLNGLLQRIYPEALVPIKLSKWTIAPFAEKIITVESDGELLGISVIYKHPFLFEKESICTFGNLEFIDDSDVAIRLFNAIEETSSNLDALQIIGPMNGSTWFDYRISHPSKEPLFLGENTHPAYYSERLKELWYTSIAQFYSAKDDTKYDDQKKLNRLIEFFNAKGMFMRPLSKDHFEEDLIKIHSLCNEAFASNFLFAPIAQHDFIELYLPLKNFIDFNYSKVVTEGDEIVAFFLVIPNLLSHNKELIIKTVARHPDRKYQGIGSYLVADFKYHSTQNHQEECIHAFMHEDNDSTLISNRFNGEIIRHYSLYSKTLNT